MNRVHMSALLGAIGLLGACTSSADQEDCTSNQDCVAQFGAGSVCQTNGFCSVGGGGTDGGMTGDDTGSEPTPLVNGVSSELVRTVGIADLKASLKDLGQGMQDGVQAAYKAYNDDPANDGARRFVHYELNDDYDPEKSKAQLDLVIKNEVPGNPPEGKGEGRFAFAVVGSMGSPTSNAMLPQINDNQIPFFGTYSGANHLRKTPPDNVVFNTRASYRLEGETITRHMLERETNPVPASNVFAYSQSPLTIDSEGVADLADDFDTNPNALDPYGLSGYVGIEDALKGEVGGKENIPLASYRATGTNSSIAQEYFFRWLIGQAPRGLSPDISGASPQVGIAMITVASGARDFVIGVIDGMKQLKNRAKPDQISAADWQRLMTDDPARIDQLSKVSLTITSISPVGDQFTNDLKAAGATTYCSNEYPILVSQVVPAPDGQTGLAREFREDLMNYDSNITPGYVNFEGWIAGKVWIRAVTSVEGPLTVESLVSTLDSGFSYDLGTGAPIAFSASNHDGSRVVYGSRISADCTYQEFAFEASN